MERTGLPSEPLELVPCSSDQSTSSLPPPRAPPSSTSPVLPFPTISAHKQSLTQDPPPRRRPRFSLTSIVRQSLSLSRSPPSSQLHSDDCPPTIGHQARVCYVVMTGALPRDSAMKGGGKLKKSGKENQFSKTQSKDVKPVVKPKAVKKLKSDLTKPDKARMIVADLKRMEVPEESSTSSTSPCSHPSKPRAFSLPPLIEEDSTLSTPDFVDYSQPTTGESNPRPPFTVLELDSFSLPTSEGGLAGLASARSGAFEILADVSGALVRRSGVRDGFVAHLDAVAVFICTFIYFSPHIVR